MPARLSRWPLLSATKAQTKREYIETPKLNCRPLTCGAAAAAADIWNGSNSLTRSLSLTACVVCFLLCARIDFETLRGSYKTTRLNDHTLSGARILCVRRGATLTAHELSNCCRFSVRFLMCATPLCVLRRRAGIADYCKALMSDGFAPTSFICIELCGLGCKFCSGQNYDLAFGTVQRQLLKIEMLQLFDFMACICIYK